MRHLAALLAALLLVAGSTLAAFADDWVAVRLRGSVLQFVDGDWVKLERGASVPDDRVIRTLRNGNVEFQRGNERVTLTADTQIQIFDKGGAKPFTTVKQYFGGVTVDAEARNVQHFAVQTPYLAAVVKGTRFVVSSDESGASVAVKRGTVLVEDKIGGTSQLVPARHSAGVTKAGDVSYDGKPVATAHGNIGTEIEAGKSGVTVTTGIGRTGVSAGVGKGGVSAGKGGVSAGKGGVSAGVNVGNGVEAGVNVGGGGPLVSLKLGKLKLKL
jgi:hypothetical protein